MGSIQSEPNSDEIATIGWHLAMIQYQVLWRALESLSMKSLHPTMSTEIHSSISELNALYRSAPMNVHRWRNWDRDDFFYGWSSTLLLQLRSTILTYLLNTINKTNITVSEVSYHICITVYYYPLSSVWCLTSFINFIYSLIIFLIFLIHQQHAFEAEKSNRYTYFAS